MNTNDRCLRCGSDKIIRGVPLQDSYGGAGVQSKQAGVSVLGEPQAWLFKDRASGKLTIDICGDCGRAELQVSDFRELYEKVQKVAGSIVVVSSRPLSGTGLDAQPAAAIVTDRVRTWAHDPDNQDDTTILLARRMTSDLAASELYLLNH